MSRAAPVEQKDGVTALDDKYFYDIDGALIQRTTASYDDGKISTTRQLFYSDGKLSEAMVESDDDKTISHKWYNENEDVIKQDVDGLRTTYEYFRPGLPSKISQSDGLIYRFQYNSDGLVTERHVNDTLLWKRSLRDPTTRKLIERSEIGELKYNKFWSLASRIKFSKPIRFVFVSVH